MSTKGATSFSNFEDIALGGLGSSEDEAVSSGSGDDQSYRYSNLSTPTLTSDCSSLRSSISSFSSPTLPSNQFPRGPASSATFSPTPRSKLYSENTSMASLSQLPSNAIKRGHKQRELEFNDDADDFWPSDCLMFNVPMSPALISQEKKPIRSPKKLPSIKENESCTDLQRMDFTAHDIYMRKQRSVSAINPTAVKPRKEESRRKSDSAHVVERKCLTRPDCLPPKPVDEERRHMHEYKRLVAHAAEVEKQRLESEKNAQRRRDQQKAADARVWFNALQKGTKVDRKLWWRGVPEQYRAKAWQMALNPQPVRLQYGGDYAALNGVNVFPETGIFGSNQALHEPLLAVVSGVAQKLDLPLEKSAPLMYPAAVLLLSADDAVAAGLLAALIPKGGLVHAVLSGQEQITAEHYASYFKVFRAKFPKVYEHFITIRLSPSQYLDDMIAHLFMNTVSVEAGARLMDLLISEGEELLLRAALGLVRAHESALYQSREEALGELKRPVPCSEDVLIDTIKSVTH